jgi:hypothetical protein
MTRPLLSALAAIGLSLALVVPALAVITPSSSALTIAQAIASSSANVTGASFAAIPPSGTPNGVSTSSLTGFPVDGSSYAILTSGNVSDVDVPGGFADTSDGGSTVRGDTDLDVSILKIDLSIPAGANCLTFDFRFFSEEFPRFVGSAFNDAFIAELDTSDWTTSGSTITAPHNFAFDSSGDVVSINSTGIGGMSAAAGAGTTFDGSGDNSDGAATALLGAASPVTSGAHSLYLSLFDQGDHALDSAVFVDNLRVITVANPATDCKKGAVQVAHLTLAKNVVNTGGGTAAATDWTLSAAGPVTISGATGTSAVTGASLPAGTYALSESGPAAYSAGAWQCTGGTLQGANLTLAAGATASCTITNTFVPGPPPNPATLTLAKSVVNTGGGTAAATDWTLSATGPVTISGATGAAAITAASVPAGTYALAETGGPNGYTGSAWQCTGGTLVGANLTLAADATASCTITNTFVPGPPDPATLTLAKSVVNTGGGTAAATAWTLSATGPVTISGATGAAAVTGALVPAGTYALAESGGPANYTAGAWQCTGGTLQGANLTLAAGGTASCTITNTFVPPNPNPTPTPTAPPTSEPTSEPTSQPTSAPTEQPTAKPTEQPTSAPTEQPTAKPTEQPTSAPTEQPTAQPTEQPTAQPTEQPTSAPTEQPTAKPTEQPTAQPTEQPTAKPTEQPTAKPTEQPTAQPTEQPTAKPTSQPTAQPTSQPTAPPTEKPTPKPVTPKPTGGVEAATATPRVTPPSTDTLASPTSGNGGDGLSFALLALAVLVGTAITLMPRRTSRRKTVRRR